MSLRICITTDEYWPQTGGVGVSVDRVSKILQGMGYEIHIVFFDSDLSTIDSVEEDFPFHLLAKTDSRMLPDGRMLHVVLPGREFGNPDKTKSLQEFQLQLQNLNDRYHFDIFHAFYISATGFITGIVAKRGGAKFIASVRGNDLHLHIFNHRSNHIQWTLQNADMITCVSNDLVEFAAAIMGSRDKFIYIPNSIDPDLFLISPSTASDPIRSNERTEIAEKKQHNRQVIGSSGYFKRKKGLEYFLKAAIDLAKEREISCLLVGRPIASESSYWDQVFEKVAGQIDLKITGHIPHENIHSWIREMDIYVGSSLYDGFPNAVLEAMALGIPVIATRTGALRDSFVDGTDLLLVEPGSSEAIGHALKRLIDDPVFSCKVGEQGRSRVLKDFTIEREASAWQYCYSFCHY